MKEPIQFEGNCYVLLEGNWIHPIARQRHNLVWYPERSMTLLERNQYRPYVKSVVTSDAWIIGCYPREKVRVLEEDGHWSWPDYQTYGASHNSITCYSLGIRGTIPAMVLDGGDEVQKFIADYKARVEKANKNA